MVALDRTKKKYISQKNVRSKFLKSKKNKRSNWNGMNAEIEQ